MFCSKMVIIELDNNNFQSKAAYELLELSTW